MRSRRQSGRYLTICCPSDVGAGENSQSLLPEGVARAPEELGSFVPSLFLLFIPHNRVTFLGIDTLSLPCRWTSRSSEDEGKGLHRKASEHVTGA